MEAAANIYNDEVPFGAPGYFPRHWKEELDGLESDFQRLTSVRQALSSQPATKAPPISASAPGGTCLSTACRMTRLPRSAGFPALCPQRSRRLPRSNGCGFGIGISTQYEDYETAAMTFDAARTIRAISGFIHRCQWDLMYFVEVMDAQGRGRMYPDLERETPYVVVRVQR